MRRILIRIAIGVAFVVVCFVGGIMLVNFVMGYMVGRGDEAMVPDLHGVDVVEARRLLQEQDLTLTIAGQRYSDELAPDAVVEQEPRAGRRMKRSRPIQVVTSLGPELATVPDLRGVPLPEASEMLRNANLAPGDVDRAHVEGIAAEAVVLSRPEAGQPVRKGTVVAMLVSKGPRPADWVMPDLRGRSEARALATLETLGLRANVSRSREKGGRSRTVVSQDPAPGDRVEEGAEVDLVIAP